MQLKEL